MKLTQIHWTSHECKHKPFCWEAGCEPGVYLTIHEVSLKDWLLHNLGIRLVFHQHRLDGEALLLHFSRENRT